MDYTIDFNEIDDILKEAQENISQRKKSKEANNEKIQSNFRDDESCANQNDVETVPSEATKNNTQLKPSTSTASAASKKKSPIDLKIFFEERMTKWDMALNELAILQENVAKQSEKDQTLADEVSLFSTNADSNHSDKLSLSQLVSDTSSKPSISPHVTGFTKCGTNNPYCKSAQSPSQEWKDCTNKLPNPVHPICCGPSLVKPIFDSKIEKLENQIVKHCLEIKDTNILLGQCCRSKEVLECQKHALHNLLLKLCGKIKELERKLHTIKMAICCPNMPAICTSSFDCCEEIKNMRRIEDKIETCHNGLKHKECLVKICKRTVEVMHEDQKQWEHDIEKMNKIKEGLQKQIDTMKEKVCKKSGGGPLLVSRRFSRDKYRTSNTMRRSAEKSGSEGVPHYRHQQQTHRSSGNRRSQCDHFEEEEEQSFD